MLSLAVATGLSPRSRGSQNESFASAKEERSIPALAGKPRYVLRGSHLGQVYPRARGEAIVNLDNAIETLGLSPRSRGSRFGMWRAGRPIRSIPALAGKPSSQVRRARFCKVYPRARGEAGLEDLFRRPGEGLSPRSRGSRRSPPPRRGPRGSIPALAGKPWRKPSPSLRVWVYPRARGEAPRGKVGDLSRQGLSPRSRGSRDELRADQRPPGSIPALAGKPVSRASMASSTRVYPRARGEAWTTAGGWRTTTGLSPRSRGSPAASVLQREGWGSIPALAGKPHCRDLLSRPGRVYPRARGEARAKRRSLTFPGGLSPRSRGSRRQRHVIPARRGSIPALAGKPCSQR